MRLSFYLNSDACSGCKTCQVACKDRNDLPAGVHWRRVFEVTAGGWARSGPAWVPDLAAYYLSVSCLHCAIPACAGQCSVDAIWKRPDGVVLIDQDRCTKCYKCEADCPYGAITHGRPGDPVGKCDFCPDEVDAGRPPACVAACPNRALAVGDLLDLRKAHGLVDQVFPLADPSRAEPSVVITPHRQAASMRDRSPAVANWEEV